MPIDKLLYKAYCNKLQQSFYRVTVLSRDFPTLFPTRTGSRNQKNKTQSKVNAPMNGQNIDLLISSTPWTLTWNATPINTNLANSSEKHSYRQKRTTVHTISIALTLLKTKLYLTRSLSALFHLGRCFPTLALMKQLRPTGFLAFCFTKYQSQVQRGIKFYPSAPRPIPLAAKQ